MTAKNNQPITKHSKFATSLLFLAVVVFQGCTAVNTFPTTARPGDTISVMVGGSENARKDTVSASLTDGNNVVWDLQALGLIRSVFSLRPDGRAYGLHYSDTVGISAPWKKGHEPIQTVMVIDVPNSGIAFGTASLSVNLNTSDDSSGVIPPYTIALNIVDVPGQPGISDTFLRQNFDTVNQPVNFPDLEPAPHAKISFGSSGFSATPGATLGAAELVVDFDETVVNGDDINVYVADSTTQRGSITTPAPFGKNQRMVSWRQDGTKLFISVVAPTGIEDKFLQIYVVHPRGLSGDPGLSLVSTTGYDLNGNVITAIPSFSYFP